MPVQTQLQQRRGTAASWTSTNPTLAAGEIGFESDTNKFKIGTGSTAWASLSYWVQDPVTTKGDLYTFSTTDTRLPVGANGETIVADSSTSTGLRYQGSQAAGKNIMINGGMDIWQRGTSIAVASNSATYVSDRFLGYCFGNTQTYSQSTTVPTTQFQYSLRIGGATSVTASQVRQRIEAANTLQIANATSVTLSFWVYLSAATNATVYLNLDTPTSTVNDFSAVTSRVYQANIGTATNNAWTKISYTFNPSSFTNITYGLQTILDFASALANASYYALFTGFQLELGSVATTFTRAGGTLQGELAACQRYYWRTNAGEPYSPYGTGAAQTTTKQNATVLFPVIMRTKPSAVDFNALLVLNPGVAGVAVTALTQSEGNTKSSFLSATVASGLTANSFYVLSADGTSNGYLGFSAEL
jgi:hypothetical protein